MGQKLGQHFLHEKSVLTDIIGAGNLAPDGTFLEIGPGKGALTELLMTNSKRVVAIEKDSTLIPYLHDKFKSEIESGKLALHEGDILDASLVTNTLSEVGEYKLIANIPYYITGAIIRTFLSHEKQPSQIVLLIQKEVAQRIIGREGHTILSLAVHAYGAPRIVRVVKRGCFTPPPAVDSAVISIENISRSNFPNKESELAFFKTVRAGFSKPRKTIFNNLRGFYEQGTVTDALKGCAVEPATRPGKVALTSWLRISAILNST